MKKSLLAPAVGAALGVFGGVPVYADFIEDSKLTF